MSDASHPSPDPRPRPQYGEYATPEEQRARIRQPAASAALEAGIAPAEAAAPPAAASPVTAPAGAGPVARRGPLVDRIITIGLLVYGLINVVASVPEFIDFSAFATTWMDIAGIDADFTNYAQGRLWGSIAAIVLSVGWLLTAALSWLRLRRGKLSFWIPLVGAAVSFLIVTVCLSIPLFSDPAVISFLTSGAGSVTG